MDDTYLSFAFTLSDVTSKDSVIDGLNEMVINGGSISTKYAAELGVQIDDNILMARLSSQVRVGFQEEKALGRDFDQEKADDVAHNNLVYHRDTEKVSLQFNDSDGNAVITYEGDAAGQKKRIDSDLQTYGRYVELRKAALALAGKDPQNEDLASYGLADLVGNDKITMSGHLKK